MCVLQCASETLQLYVRLSATRYRRSRRQLAFDRFSFATTECGCCFQHAAGRHVAAGVEINVPLVVSYSRGVSDWLAAGIFGDVC